MLLLVVRRTWDNLGTSVVEAATSTAKPIGSLLIIILMLLMMQIGRVRDTRVEGSIAATARIIKLKASLVMVV